MWKTYGLLLSKVCPNWSLSMDGQEWVIRVSISPPKLTDRLAWAYSDWLTSSVITESSYAAFGEALEAVNAGTGL